MLVLDTDHLGEFQKGTSPAAQRLKRRLDEVSLPVATTVISVEEIMRGWLAAIRRETQPGEQIRSYARLVDLFAFFAAWDILGWEAPAVERLKSLRQRKVRIGTMDLKIASIALAHDATVLTSNLRDFGQVPDLRAEDWLT
ncbi:MAG: type II toxin-antitoxin system VapC family toxin [Planctomycetaceae bacterium]|nr:MAG: type II toxin-antitoxin system VapC family toxin [Planctomycetaceae bacterium]